MGGRLANTYGECAVPDSPFRIFLRRRLLAVVFDIAGPQGRHAAVRTCLAREAWSRRAGRRFGRRRPARAEALLPGCGRLDRAPCEHIDHGPAIFLAAVQVGIDEFEAIAGARSRCSRPGGQFGTA